MSRQTTVATLPADARDALKEPFGPVFPDVASLLEGVAPTAVLAVGDVVTHHFLAAGRPPDAAVVDHRTERETVEEAVAATLADADADTTTGVPNDPGTLSAELIDALRAAVDDDAPHVVEVEGEEDLAVLPAVLLAPEGAVVVYGQPGEGMVRIDVDAAVRGRVRELFGRLETTPALRETLPEASKSF
ncbi:MAG: GTP-dependent dephospho-CoA kinase family protein [Halobacteriaceae archaeon]